MKSQSKTKGFVILYAVLVAGVVSIGGVLLANIIVKQLILSSLGRESQFAYYAANIGDECARQGNTRRAFGRYVEGFDSDGYIYEEGEISLLDCAEDDSISGPISGSIGNILFEKFTFTVKSNQNSNGPCAETTIWIRSEPGVPYLIESKGVNYCTQSDHPRRVEKVIFRSSGTN